MGTRTDKRSRSGAHQPCPHCGKRLRTAKGILMHAAEVHGIPLPARHARVMTPSEPVSGAQP